MNECRNSPYHLARASPELWTSLRRAVNTWPAQPKRTTINTYSAAAQLAKKGQCTSRFAPTSFSVSANAAYCCSPLRTAAKERGEPSVAATGCRLAAIWTKALKGNCARARIVARHRKRHAIQNASRQQTRAKHGESTRQSYAWWVRRRGNGYISKSCKSARFVRKTASALP